MIKKGSNFNDLYNYRNSKYFIRTVKEARKFEMKKDQVTYKGRTIRKSQDFPTETLKP